MPQNKNSILQIWGCLKGGNKTSYSEVGLTFWNKEGHFVFIKWVAAICAEMILSNHFIVIAYCLELQNRRIAL